jgi:hypothetical protein
VAAEFLGGGFVSGIFLKTVLHHLSSSVFVWGMVSLFGGGVLLFWQMQCRLFGGDGVMVTM